LPVDKYLSQGLLLANSAATPQNTQWCIGDIPMPPPQFQMRQLVSCVTGPVTLTFTLVDPKKLGPMPASAFVMTVTFRSLGVNGVYPQEPWKISAFDANHNLLEMQQGMTGVQNYEPRAQTFTFYRPEIYSVELVAPGVMTSTSIQSVHFDQYSLKVAKP
jgi:hypothetical protein